MSSFLYRSLNVELAQPLSQASSNGNFSQNLGSLCHKIKYFLPGHLGNWAPGCPLVLFPQDWNHLEPFECHAIRHSSSTNLNLIFVFALAISSCPSPGVYPLLFFFIFFPCVLVCHFSASYLHLWLKSLHFFPALGYGSDAVEHCAMAGEQGAGKRVQGTGNPWRTFVRGSCGSSNVRAVGHYYTSFSGVGGEWLEVQYQQQTNHPSTHLCTHVGP